MRIESVEVSVYVVPTDAPESDGTLEWDSTTMVIVEVSSGGIRGLGYTYADAAAATFVREHLTRELVGRDPMDIPRLYDRMVRATRNLGRPGLAAMAISAADSALWDLKARLLKMPLVM